VGNYSCTMCPDHTEYDVIRMQCRYYNWPYHWIWCVDSWHDCNSYH
ncbi:hypothetical protein EE612_050348, partial [Oryza sativa]